MKIRILPFNEALKKSNVCYREHLNEGDCQCIGISRSKWRDNVVLEVIGVSSRGYYLGNDGFFYCDCCCEVIE